MSLFLFSVNSSQSETIPRHILDTLHPVDPKFTYCILGKSDVGCVAMFVCVAMK